MRKLHYWSRKPQISVCIEGNNGILFNSDTGREKVINATGLIIWEAMNGVARIDDMIEALARRYDIPEAAEIQSDVSIFVDELHCDGFVEASEVPASMPIGAEVYSRIEEAPRDFDLSLTGRCNLHCNYCFYADEMAGRNDLPVDRWLDFFSELKHLAVRNVTLSGGEVFMRPDLWTLIDGVVEARMRYSILSNGTLISEDILQHFQEKKRKNRLNSIQISIDGSCAEIHDATRGRGSFDKAVRGLRLLKEAGFPVTVRVTVNRHNVNDLDNIARLLLDDIGIPKFSTNDAIPMGTGCARQESIVLTPWQRLEAMQAQVCLEANRPGCIQASAGSLALWHMFGEMEHARRTGEPSLRWQMGFLSSCACMFCKLAVHHDGMIVPCNMLASASLGEIGKTPIHSIWQQHPLLKEMRGRRRIRMKDVTGCQECEWNPYCNGGCPAVVFTQTGNLYLPNSECCYRKFIQETDDGFRKKVMALKPSASCEP